MARRRSILAVVLLVATTVVLPVAANAEDDTSPPQFGSPTANALEIIPASIDTAAADQTITFRAHLVDDLSGVADWSQARFRSPSGGQFVDALFGSLISGTEFDGVWEYTATLPQYAEAGTWHLEYVILADVTGNFEYLNGPTSPSGPPFVPVDLATSFENTAVVDDISAPAFTAPTSSALEIVPTVVDTAGGAQSITFRAHLADGPAGLARAGYSSSPSQARFRSPSGAQFVDAVFFENRISGDDTDGVWEYTATLPQYAESGIWTLEYVLLVDQLGNSVSLYPDDGSNPGPFLPADLASSFENVAVIDDTTPPELGLPTSSALQITPGVVYTGLADATVTFTAHLTDDVAGAARAGYSSSPSQARFRSPSGGQFVDAVFFENRISGTDNDGVWEYTATLPRYSEAGLWVLEYFLVVDQLGNTEYLYADDGVNPGPYVPGDLVSSFVVNADGSKVEESVAGIPVSTDISGDGATAETPVETAVTTPSGGFVSITTDLPTAPTPYTLIGNIVTITAPAATYPGMLKIVFTVDATLVALAPSGVDVYRDGVVVPPCGVVPPPEAALTPACEGSEVAIAGGDVEVTVYTLAASEWTLGAAEGCVGKRGKDCKPTHPTHPPKPPKGGWHGTRPD